MSTSFFPQGDPQAAPGSEPWAQFQRIALLHGTKETDFNIDFLWKHAEPFLDYHAWRLLKKEVEDKATGKTNLVPFTDFKDFVTSPRPWGLGQPDYQLFTYKLMAKVGERAAELLAVSPGEDKGGHHSLYKDAAATIAAAPEGQSKRKSENLRAILRAPELVQDLYRQGLIAQTVAAKLGPKKPTPEQAARIAQARQALEKLDRTGTKRAVMARSRKIVERAMAIPQTTPLDTLRVTWTRASDEDRLALLCSLDHAEWLALVTQVEARRQDASGQDH